MPKMKKAPATKAPATKVSSAHQGLRIQFSKIWMRRLLPKLLRGCN
jgi:hypothetical protein